MSLHPQLVDHLTQARQGPPLHALTIGEIRADMAAAMAPLHKPPVDNVANLAVAQTAHEIPVRLYRPRPGLLPVVIYLHGGGWIAGNLDTHDAFCRHLANRTRYAVLAVDYRLAPEHPYPAAIDDVDAAYRWLTRHGRTHDLDTTRIAIAGDSAGANLAAALTLRLRNTHRPPISHQTLVYPLLDTDLTTPTYRDYGTDYLLTTQGIQLLLDAYTPDSALRTNPDIAPLQATDHTNLPPALIHTAEYDPLRHEAETYAHKLHTAGVDVTLTQWDGMIHGFYELLDTLDTAQDGLNHIATHITAAL